MAQIGLGVLAGTVPPVHPNCVCKIDAAGWHLGESASGPCEVCRAARVAWNVLYAATIAKGVQVTNEKGRTRHTAEAREVAGAFHGYASTWDVDSGMLQFKRGAFAKSIQERSRDIPVMVKHARDGGDVFEQVGILTGAHEDEIGLAISGRFYDDALSKSVQEKVKAGAPRGLSVGYIEIQGRDIDGVRVITEAKFLEVTITNIPANTRAKILDARTEEPVAPPGAAPTQPRWDTFAALELDLLEVSRR